MLRSFKLKIALVSVIFSGLLLTTFGFYFVRMSFRIGLERVDLELDAHTGSWLKPRAFPRGAFDGPDDRLIKRAQGLERKGVYIHFSRPDGSALYVSEMWPEDVDTTEILRCAAATLPPPPDDRNQDERRRRGEPPVSDKVFRTAGNWRMAGGCNPESRLVLVKSLAGLRHEVGAFRRYTLIAAPPVFLVLIISGWILAKMALRPVKAVSQTARAIGARELDRRISVNGTDDEFRELIDTMNGMFNRLEVGFKQATRFSADAAHELKTPLALMQAQLESALQDAPDNSPWQKTFVELFDETQRLDTIVRKLLLLSQADSGRMPLSKEIIDFSAFVQDAGADIGLLNPDLSVQCDIASGLMVEGDRGLLSQLIQNLVSNAVKYCGGESPVHLSLTRIDDGAVFQISNRGEGIPADECDKVFDRFYRVDKVRSSRSEGTGLGLSLAREIARAHGGSLELVDGRPGETTFRLMLPVTTP